MSDGDNAADPSPHVLIATNALSGGGAQRSNLQIACGLSRSGFSTSVLTVRPRADQHVDEFDPSINLHDLDEANWPRWTRAPKVLCSVLRVVRAEKVDLVITGSFGLNQVLLAARAFRVLRRPLIVVEHLGIEFRLAVLSRSAPFTVPIFCRILSWLYRHSEKVVAVSNGVANEFRDALELPSNTVMTIYNGVDGDAIRSKTSQRPESRFAEVFDALPRPITIAVGRLEPQKAHEDLVAAFALLSVELRGSLIILGEGSRREMLSSLATELGLDSALHLPGHMENPWWFMARSDVFALSSHYEGFGLVLIEALACEVPVVSTDCPSGPREILENVASAQLVPVGDPAALSSALAAILESRTDAPPVAMRSPVGIRSQDRFSHELHAEQFAKVARSVHTRRIH